MAYDPRMLQMAQMGVSMMGPQQGNPFERNAPRQKQWWEQPIPGRPAQMGGQQGDPNDPNRSAAKQPQPSLMQMLMLGGKVAMIAPEAPMAAPPPGLLQIGRQGYGGES